MHTPGRTSTLSVLISINIMVSASTNTLPVERKQKSITPPVEASTNMLLVERKQKSITPPMEANTSLSVFVDTRAVLHCPNATSNVLVVTWSVIFRDNTSCIRAYRTDSNKTREKTCTDERISWDSRPDQNFALRINPVAITHEGYYKCEVITPDGNFCHGHHLQVLVPPKVTLSLGENGTTVCWAVAGKPAAQISWTPTGDCHTVEERLGNDTVTVQSTCHWEDRQVSEVSCFVSHVTGNNSLSIELNQGAITLEFPASALLVILYVKFSLFLVIILVIVGFTYFQRINHCRA
ncbi:cell surface glycoprotein CD200 receptor 2-like isoform X1 [Canis aureus]